MSTQHTSASEAADAARFVSALAPAIPRAPHRTSDAAGRHPAFARPFSRSFIYARTMASIFGMVNGYEQVGEKPAPYQPPGARSSNPGPQGPPRRPDERGAGSREAGGGGCGRLELLRRLEVVQASRPPPPSLHQLGPEARVGRPSLPDELPKQLPRGSRPGRGRRPRQPARQPLRRPRQRPDAQESMNLGNKYARSYSSKNPPPRPSDVAEAEAEQRARAVVHGRARHGQGTRAKGEEEETPEDCGKPWMLGGGGVSRPPRRGARARCPITR